MNKFCELLNMIKFETECRSLKSHVILSHKQVGKGWYHWCDGCMCGGGGEMCKVLLQYISTHTIFCLHFASPQLTQHTGRMGI